MANLRCDIVTPSAQLASTEAHMVVVPGKEGEMGFLPGHAPLVSALADGVVRLRSEEGSELDRFVVSGGYVEVTGEKVIVLADQAASVASLNKDELNAQLQELTLELQALASEQDEPSATRSTLESLKRWYELCLTQL